MNIPDISKSISKSSGDNLVFHFVEEVRPYKDNIKQDNAKTDAPRKTLNAFSLQENNKILMFQTVFKTAFK